ncbi:sirohydrochlorin chelatase [Streptomyces microflavus]|uniref:sirohydrochlorin chelatase n=1 Tax=Streptomyces microflavus TaxID=1919 RepID=UPI0033C8F7D3
MGRPHIIAACGHEAGYGTALRHLTGPDTTVVTSGRELYRALAARPLQEDVAVVPMTLGRDPELVADAARTVRSLPPGPRRSVAVTEPFGSSGHLVGWLRAKALEVSAEVALLLTAPSGDPYQDAELFRVAHLVRRNGRHRLVETSLVGGDPNLAEAVRRCRLLGAGQVVLLTATFLPPPVPSAPAGVSVLDAGPLLSPAALGAVLSARAAKAVQRLRDSGENGLAAALTAAEEHGLSHSHGPGGNHHHHHHHGSGGEHSHHHGPPQEQTPLTEVQHNHSSPHAPSFAATGVRSSP